MEVPKAEKTYCAKYSERVPSWKFGATEPVDAIILPQVMRKSWRSILNSPTPLLTRRDQNGAARILSKPVQGRVLCSGSLRCAFLSV